MRGPASCLDGLFVGKKGTSPDRILRSGFFLFKKSGRIDFMSVSDMKFSRIIKHYLLLSILFSYLLPAGMAEGGPDQEVFTSDKIVVFAKRIDTSYQTGDVDMEQTPAFYSLIEREAFEGKMEGLAEIIEKEAGVQVRQSGGIGQLFLGVAPRLHRRSGDGICGWHSPERRPPAAALISVTSPSPTSSPLKSTAASPPSTSERPPSGALLTSKPAVQKKS